MFYWKRFLTIFAVVGVVAFGAGRAWACDAGQYEETGDDGEVVCVDCPVGYYCVGDGTAQQCSGNTISNTKGASGCVGCVVGSNTPFANSAHTQCVACDGASEYSEQGVCLVCGAGNYVTPNRLCEECQSGYYCDGGGDMQFCPKGSFSGVGQSSCIYCATGYTTSDVGTQYDVDSGESPCVKIRVKLRIGADYDVLPDCLTEGKINKNVIKNN